MRTIEISTDVFAKIWAHHLDGEESEDAILRRLLGAQQAAATDLTTTPEADRKILWRDDVRSALVALGGKAHLKAIYAKVRQLRVEGQRSVPPNFEAIVRRELEYNSADSDAFTGKNDWFRSVGGIGSGHWAVRKRITKL